MSADVKDVKAAHTPGLMLAALTDHPETGEDAWSVDGPDFNIALCDAPGGDEVNKVNAEFIALAWNCHDGLLAALRPFAHCEHVGSLNKRDCRDLQKSEQWQAEPSLQNHLCNGCKAKDAIAKAEDLQPTPVATSTETP